MNIKNPEILLVEDNKYDIELTIRSFEKNNILDKLFIVKDGEEALDFIFAQGDYKEIRTGKKPKLILLDLKLPKIDGMQVLKKIKSNINTKNIPVVILTSSGEETDIINAMKYGANSYIIKPLKYDKLVAVIRDIYNYWLGLNEYFV